MKIETEVIDRLYLELSQVTKAKTNRELLLENNLKEANELLRSCYSIAERKGEDTNWVGIQNQLIKILDKQLLIINQLNQVSRD
jgi:hypothetical protein